MRVSCQRQKYDWKVRKNKTFFISSEKEKKWRKILAKVPSSKNVLDEGEKFFILNFCEFGWI